MTRTILIVALACLLAPATDLYAQSDFSAGASDPATEGDVSALSLRHGWGGGGSDARVARHYSRYAFQDDAGAAEATKTAATNDDDIWTRKRLTGDWGGARTDLENHGIKIGLRLTQYFQGVASGGVNTNFAYGGKFDIHLDLDGQKMGLWEGLFINIHAENKFGTDINGDAGAFALANTTMLYPKASDSYRDMAVTQVLFEQFLSKNFGLVLGKINTVDFWTMVYPGVGGGVDGFMNTNVLAGALPWLRWLSLSEWAAGALFVTDDQQVQGGIFALDLNNVPTTTGIPEMFDDGAGVLGFWKFFFEVDEKPANVLIGVGGATREYHSFESHPTGWDPGPFTRLLEAVENKDDGVWSVAIYYEQILWQEPANDKQNLRFFTGWNVSDGDPSFGKFAGMASVEATGLLFDREYDRAGIGAFYSKLSSDFKKTMNGVGIDLRDTWGLELYYNAEITPWFHLTGDVQVVQNQNDDDDPAVILGLRGVVEF